MSGLSEKDCVPCRGGVPPLQGRELTLLLAQLPSGWEVVEEHHLTKRFPFTEFTDGLAFLNRVAALCEEQGHHGDLTLAWGSVTLTVWTHKIDGLTESDFVWAAKADALA